MRVLERLLQDTKRQEQKKRQVGRQEDEEDTMAYMERGKTRFLNQETGAFSTKTFEGINTKGSVFDETAVFRTNPGMPE